MTKTSTLKTALMATLCAITVQANAKPNDVRLEINLQTIVAMHIPTGCSSVMEYDDGVFVQAFIVDPLCLPRGVLKRKIPSPEWDFQHQHSSFFRITGR